MGFRIKIRMTEGGCNWCFSVKLLRLCFQSGCISCTTLFPIENPDSISHCFRLRYPVSSALFPIWDLGTFFSWRCFLIISPCFAEMSKKRWQGHFRERAKLIGTYYVADLHNTSDIEFNFWTQGRLWRQHTQTTIFFQSWA